MLTKAKACAALTPWNCVPPPTEELSPSSRQDLNKQMRTSGTRVPTVETEQFPDRGNTFMVKLGQIGANPCTALHEHV